MNVSHTDVEFEVKLEVIETGTEENKFLKEQVNDHLYLESLLPISFTADEGYSESTED